MTKLLVRYCSLLFPVLLLVLATTPAATAVPSVRQSNLVSDIPGMARFSDPELINPWGIVYTPTGIIVVADNGTGEATMYDPKTGRAYPTVITVTAPGMDGDGAGAPTGVVYNPTSDFLIPVAPAAPAQDGLFRIRPARLIFATEDGTIAGWNPTVEDMDALIAVNNSAAGAVYKGIAMGVSTAGNTLYAANFVQKKIDVFNGSFQPITLAGSFVDPGIPADYGPFGIANLDGQIFVSYAQIKAGTHDDEPGPGHGFVSVFDTNGQFVGRFASQGSLNSPWGMVIVPKSHPHHDQVLVGNFGDGRINVFGSNDGRFLGQLRKAGSSNLTIDGLWGLALSPNANGECEDDDVGPVFFAAGPNDEADGLIGYLSFSR